MFVPVKSRILTGLWLLASGLSASGGLDTLHSLRATYAADIVLMLESPKDINQGAGCAPATLGSPGSAFCVCHWDLKNQPYLAGHEIAHLFGCDHDTITEPNDNERLPYNHAFIGPAFEFATIMSYRGYIKNFYSNPDSSFTDPGTGKFYPDRGSPRCNNTRVINERIGAVATFFNPQADIALANQVWRSSDFGDVVATNSIILNGGDSLKDSSEVWLRATKSVTINSGFYLGNKAKLTITAGSTALSKKRNIEFKRADQPLSQSMPSEFSLYATTDSRGLLAHYSIPQEGNIGMSVYDASGRLIFAKALGKKLTGEYVERISADHFDRGTMYVVRLKFGKYAKVKKVISIK